MIAMQRRSIGTMKFSVESVKLENFTDSGKRYSLSLL